MKYIKVNKKQWRAYDVSTLQRDGWKKASPELLHPNPKEKIIHFLGFHFSFGQPYCVVCGKEEIAKPVN